MKSMIIAFVGALALGTGAATGVAVVRNKAAAAEIKAKADSLQTAKDTTHVAERVIDDPRDSTAHHDSTAVAPVADSVTPAEQKHEAAPVPAPEPVKADTPAQAPQAKAPDSVVTLSEKRIAKAFATMPPKDAAKVFEVMSDADVGAILASLSDKESAAILAKLPPQRVAALSRASLRNHGAAK